MIEAGVPVVPGSKEPVHTAEEALEMAKAIGFPVMIKASSGGGGKGMRVSWSEEDFTANFQNAQMESIKGFSDDTMYLERYVEKPRHIEFQIMADKYGQCGSFRQSVLFDSAPPSEGAGGVSVCSNFRGASP